MKDGAIIILGIETSCDETSASVVKNGREMLSNVIASQADLHKKYGGVVPEIASRRHVELILPVINQSLEEAGTRLSEIDAVAVAHGPGLVGALLVGVSAAKAIAYALDKPLIGIHHIEGHIAANYIEHDGLTPPFVCLVASGGHSSIVYVESFSSFELMGRTRDDAAGEAFDKVARTIGLGYPGGPLIDKAARRGNSGAIDFPRAKLNDSSLDFSFSGLKTAVLNYLNGLKQKGEEPVIEDVAASFQQAVVDVLVRNTVQAARMKSVKTITLAGGVAANSALREQMKINAFNYGMTVLYPSPILCTDNAAMIASAAYFKYVSGRMSDLDLNVTPSLRLDES